MVTLLVSRVESAEEREERMRREHYRIRRERETDEEREARSDITKPCRHTSLQDDSTVCMSKLQSYSHEAECMC